MLCGKKISEGEKYCSSCYRSKIFDADLFFENLQKEPVLFHLYNIGFCALKEENFKLAVDTFRLTVEAMLDVFYSRFKLPETINIDNKIQTLYSDGMISYDTQQAYLEIINATLHPERIDEPEAYYLYLKLTKELDMLQRVYKIKD